MIKQNDGGPAFPCKINEVTRFWSGTEFSGSKEYGGMTLRDYFAAKAMQGFAAAPDMAGTHIDDVARQAYEVADAMISARKGGAE